MLKIPKLYDCETKLEHQFSLMLKIYFFKRRGVYFICKIYAGLSAASGCYTSKMRTCLEALKIAVQYKKLRE